jgi:hypothetical protein
VAGMDSGYARRAGAWEHPPPQPHAPHPHCALCPPRDLEPAQWGAGACSSAGQSGCLLSSGSRVRILPGAPAQSHIPIFDHDQLAVFVWRSDRAGGDTKTPKSRRTLALARRCSAALRDQKIRQAADRLAAGLPWQDHDLVFASTIGTPLGDHNVRRQFPLDHRVCRSWQQLGATGTTAHIRVAAICSWCTGRGDRVVGRAQPDRHDGAGLPASDHARPHPGR